MLGFHTQLALSTNSEAVALSPLIGWLMLLAVVWVVWGVFHYRRQLASLLFQPDDPRPVAALRIAFAGLLLLNINGLADVGEYLFTDEGIFTTDVARHLFGGAQYAGVGDGIGPGEPEGFFDAAAWWRFLQGPKFSLLFFFDTPTAYWCHLAAFDIACICFLLGFRTRFFGLCTLVLLHSFYVRNHLHWEGEDIYRTFALYLCFARCGHAYSLDNWLRCRRLKTQKNDKYQVLRGIPAWPRVLMIAQLGVAYSANGCAKTGPLWQSGDAIYYLLSVDHFSRFLPQHWIAELAPVLRVLSYLVRHWEALFLLAVVGWVMRQGLRGKLGDVSNFAARGCSRHDAALADFAEVGPREFGAQPRQDLGRETSPENSHRLLGHRGCLLWVALSMTALAIAWIAYPVHLPPEANVVTAQVRLAAMWVAVTGIVVGLCLRLRGGGSLWGGRLTAEKLYLWCLSRRIWLGFGLLFHLSLFALCNLGWFGLCHLAVYLVFFDGYEIECAVLKVWRPVARRCGWRCPKPRRWDAVDPATDRSAGDVGGCNAGSIERKSKDTLVWVVALAGVTAIAGATIFLHLHDIEAPPGVVLERMGWPVTPVVWLAVVCWVARRQKLGSMQTAKKDAADRKSIPFRRVYDPRGRLLVAVFVAYHCFGVAVFNLPDKACLSTWRTYVREPFRLWIQLSQTDQYWRMMAPNAPQYRFDLRVRVTDADGMTHDLHTDVYNAARWPPNTFVYTRSLKIHRRLAGEALGPEDWYQPWHARYLCRKWTLEHGGRRAREVSLYQLRARIPTPAEVRTHGPSDPLQHMRTHGTETLLQRADCRADPRTQAPNNLRRRYGLPAVEPDEVGLWPKHKLQAWQQARERGETPNDVPWKLVIVIAVGVWIGRSPWPQPK